MEEYGPGSQTDFQEKMKKLYMILQEHPEYRKTLPEGTLTFKSLEKILEDLENRSSPKMGRPDRETVINHDDVLNLRIALETMTFDEFVGAM